MPTPWHPTFSSSPLPAVALPKGPACCPPLCESDAGVSGLHCNERKFAASETGSQYTAALIFLLACEFCSLLPSGRGQQRMPQTRAGKEQAGWKGSGVHRGA